MKESHMPETHINSVWNRMADALERLAPPPLPVTDLNAADAFLWHGSKGWLEPLAVVSHVPLKQLKAIDHVRDILLENTRQFAKGHAANNALLWGARGMGKSSLVKSLHAYVNQQKPHALALIEIHREDLPTLEHLLALLKTSSRRFLLFSDDLSFDAGDSSYKSLKAVLDGGIHGRPENVLFYATSNRRHLMPRDMVENEQSTAIHPFEAVEEKVSLSDRFGLWLGFYPADQESYLAMVESYATALKLELNREELHAGAIEWAATRGARSGRVAWQYITDVAGRQGKSLKF